MVWLMASTCSLLVVVIAVVSPRSWRSSQSPAMVSRCSSSGAGDDPVVGEVGVEGARVAVSQLEGRGGFPVVGEAVDAFEFDRAAGGAQLGEHPAAADGLQLAGVTDERRAATAALVGEYG